MITSWSPKLSQIAQHKPIWNSFINFIIDFNTIMATHNNKISAKPDQRNLPILYQNQTHNHDVRLDANYDLELFLKIVSFFKKKNSG
jgi:hypothetical protein